MAELVGLGKNLGTELLLKLPLYLLPATVVGVLSHRGIKSRMGRWCIGLLALGLSAGLLYGVLRALGVILYPHDKVGMSYYWYGSSFRDEGIRTAAFCGLLLLAAAIPRMGKLLDKK